MSTSESAKQAANLALVKTQSLHSRVVDQIQQMIIEGALHRAHV